MQLIRKIDVQYLFDRSSRLSKHYPDRISCLLWPIKEARIEFKAAKFRTEDVELQGDWKAYKPVETIIHPDEVKADFEEVDAEEVAFDTAKHAVSSHPVRISVCHSKSAQLQNEGYGTSWPNVTLLTLRSCQNSCQMTISSIKDTGVPLSLTSETATYTTNKNRRNGFYFSKTQNVISVLKLD